MLAAMAVSLGLSACAGVSGDTAPRGAADGVPQAAWPASLNITAINVNVPRTLQVSEANRYYPGGDIVWRGDPIGDRHAQVEAIFREGASRGTKGMTSGAPVILDIEVTRFHALTEKARYSTGGVHDINFSVSLRDAATGQALSPPRQLQADMKAFGGQAAIAADQRGETQKVRITAHLAEVIRADLTRPGSYQAENLGLMSVFDRY
ncbi:hypothetical protein DC366_00455 [Pelagivirga sediminicola]|uniref:Lipoprotein n=2 Tax=Pelagivirga sediminicola TaxID=2170575 RepID=A0A2T7GC99_9RHOB|nr:hypothetical protein DC366_00455 [Pelagivirga sediminicola]